MESSEEIEQLQLGHVQFLKSEPSDRLSQSNFGLDDPLAFDSTETDTKSSEEYAPDLLEIVHDRADESPRLDLESHAQQKKKNNIRKVLRNGKIEKKNKTILQRAFCDICKRMYKNNDILTKHIDQFHKTGNHQFRCNKCGAGYAREDDFNHHMNNDPECGSKKCHMCGLVYADESKLQTHLRQKHSIIREDYPFKCLHCDRGYDKRNSLKRHVKRKHSLRQETDDDSNLNRKEKEENLFCVNCKIKFANEMDFNNHLDGNDSCKFPVCELCGRIYASVKSWKLHMRIKHKVSADWCEFKCQFCHLEYKKYDSLYKHISRKHPEVTYASVETEILKCDKCNNSFESETNYKEHFDSNGFCKTLECRICKFIFSRLSFLQIHMKKKHGIFEQNFKFKFSCHYCQEEFMKKSTLQSHIKTTHTERRSVVYKCPTCDAQFNLRDSLQKHVRRKHVVKSDISDSSNRPYYKGRFDEFDVLSIHADQSHQNGLTETNLAPIDQSPNKRFQCRMCLQYYKNLQTLKSHIRWSHSMIRKTYKPRPKNKHISCNIFDNNAPHSECKTTTQNTTDGEYVKFPIKTDVLIKSEPCDISSNCQVSTIDRTTVTNIKQNKGEIEGCNFKSDVQSNSHESDVNEKKMFCNFCEFKTYNLSNYINHIREHSVERLSSNK